MSLNQHLCHTYGSVHTSSGKYTSLQWKNTPYWLLVTNTNLSESLLPNLPLGYQASTRFSRVFARSSRYRVNHDIPTISTLYSSRSFNGVCQTRLLLVPTIVRHSPNQKVWFTAPSWTKNTLKGVGVYCFDPQPPFGL